MPAGDDVHFARHPGEQILGWIFEVEEHGIALRFGIGRGHDRSDGGVELPVPIGIHLEDGFHADLHFADVFFVHFATHVIFSRRNGEQIRCRRSRTRRRSP